MNDKYAKEIAKELKLIRRELEKRNAPSALTPSAQEEMAFKRHLKSIAEDMNSVKESERVTNK